jgi:pyridinium-3,5-bisthiocarboxylic acid mononucleotide nickel chelatase
MRAVYFDCFAGVSGDMIIGAQLDLGVDLESLKQQLSALGLDGYEIKSRRVERSGISAAKFDVEVNQAAQPARTLADIRSIIVGSGTTDHVRDQAIRVFERLADAEARVHGTTPDKIHFHEVGAVDSIIDIVGAMIGFELLGVERFFCSPLRLGSGSVDSQHGRLPIPAPATAELLRGAPVYAGELEGEFVTPTGAAIVATFCEEFGPMPQMKVARIGYGAGSRDPKGFPNALRLMIGELEEADELASPVAGAMLPQRDTDPVQIPKGRSAAQTEVYATPDEQTKVYATPDETIVVIETNIDDMNPQVYSFVMERAFALGALDVFMIPAQMKKDRPGVLLTVLCKPETAEAMIEMLLVETTTLGVRYYEAKRRVLDRTIETVETAYGPVRIKVARDGARTLHFQPEFEDCARVAASANVPLLEVHGAAAAAYRNRLRPDSEANG